MRVCVCRDEAHIDTIIQKTNKKKKKKKKKRTCNSKIDCYNFKYILVPKKKKKPEEKQTYLFKKTVQEARVITCSVISK